MKWWELCTLKLHCGLAERVDPSFTPKPGYHKVLVICELAVFPEVPYIFDVASNLSGGSGVVKALGFREKG
jgi:hypothetical protein